MQKCDVVVIGAGPAGSSAAKTLTAAGRKVILVDKKPFPRDKPCAGVLSPKVRTLIDIPDGIIERPLVGYRIYPPSGRVLESPFPDPGAIVDRGVFDEFLLGGEKPKTALVRSIKGDAGDLIVRGEGWGCSAKMIIGADGCGSIARKTIGANWGTVAVSAQYTVAMSRGIIDHRIGDWFEVYYSLENGYGWISPMKDTIKVGVGIISDYLDNNIDEILDDFKKSPMVREKLQGGTIIAKDRHSIPMGGPLDTLAGNGILLAGDAGGFVYPGTGEGIYYAIKSGKIAGEVANEILKKENYDDLPSKYTKALDKKGLLGLRDIDFVERYLASSERAEDYVRGLRAVASR